ncbi:CBS domain-containing protein [Kitasatospora phosalacinea]|uniref:CBS domain-containing protein n=1 Tax=Kitasatospora phosalacinea TaxID=2065 RepID=A0ABW6GVV1_9ACTN
MTVGDLVDAGCLDVGSDLTFERPQCGETHRATVAADGKVKLADGQLFGSPSRAAIAAVGSGSFDGWRAWTLGDGRTLDQIRQVFLNEAALAASAALGTSAAPAGEAPETDGLSPAKRHGLLKQARERADSKSPMQLTVRQLLGWWGARRRGYLIVKQIDAELANHGLTTLPQFDKVNSDSIVQLVATQQPEEDTAPARGDGPGTAEPEASAVEEETEAGLTVGNLPSALSEVVSIPPDATYEDAITLMLIHDFSQLPVISGRSLRGAVTWKSIARTRHANPDAPLSEAIAPAYDVAYDRYLIDILPALAEHDFVVVRDQTRRIAGIVTASDVAAAYGAMAGPFFLIGELDQRLRSVITRNFDLDDIRHHCDPDGRRGIRSFDDLSIGDYQRLLQSNELWDRLGWPLNRKTFCGRLDTIRRIRNDLMHFNPDPLPDDTVEMVRNMISLLCEYGG